MMNADTIFLFVVVWVAVIFIIKALRAERQKADLIKRFDFERDEERKSRIFGFEVASNIYLKARDRFKGDETKTVPFAILATASALNADIRIKEQGLDVINSLTQEVKERQTKHAEFEKTTKKLIEDLIAQVKKNEMSLEEAAVVLQNIVNDRNGQIVYAKEVLDFFTV